MPQAQSHPQAHRVALVIGISDYEGHLRLPNPINDAALMTETLLHLGFEVIGGATDDGGEGANLDSAGIWSAFGKFYDRLSPGGTALIYYAGHAMQVAEENYLVPLRVDFSRGDPTGQLVPLRQLINRAGTKVGPAGNVLVFLDACRDNPLSWQQMQEIAGQLQRHEQDQKPLARTRSAVPRDGLTMFRLPRAEQSARKFIALATAPGEVAFDGDPDTSVNSPFAVALSQHLCTRGLDLDAAYHRVASDVRDCVWQTMGNVQEPWRESNLDRPFYMVPHTLSPMWWLAFAGLLAGLVVSTLLFDGSKIQSPLEQPWLWLLGLPFGLVAAWGSMRWGSGKPLDAVIAALGPVVGFVLALSLLLLAPAHRPNPDAGPLAAEQTMLADVFFYISAASCLLFFIGTFITKRTNTVVGHAASLRSIDKLVHWSLPLLMLAGLLIMHYLLTHATTRANPALTAMGLHALAAGIIYASSAVIACKPQRAIFDGFGAFTGAIAVGILMAVFFAGFVWMTGGGRNPSGSDPLALAAFGTAWHAVLGAQLGYCFAHYVAEHERK